MSDRERHEAEPGVPPEADTPEEALLLHEWADSLGTADKIPEEVLGLLDGSLDDREAARVRRRLADDPELARAAGELLESLRGTAEQALGREAPGRLLAEATELVPREVAPRPRTGFLFRLLEGARAAYSPGLAAAGAGALLLAFVLVQRDRTSAPEDVLRSTGADTGAIALQSPAPDALVTGALDVSWQAVPGAVRYRVVLVDAENGEVIEAGHTAETHLSTEPEALAGRLDSREPRVLRWIVRARLLDGTEVSSEPRRVSWSER